MMTVPREQTHSAWPITSQSSSSRMVFLPGRVGSSRRWVGVPADHAVMKTAGRKSRTILTANNPRYQLGELWLTSENPDSRLKKTGPGDSRAKKAEFWRPKASGHAASYQAASFNPGPPSARSSSHTRQALGSGAGGAELEPTSGRVHPPLLRTEHRVYQYKRLPDLPPA